MSTEQKIHEIELGDHLCMLYDDEREKLFTEILFIMEGLKNDELVLVLNESEEEIIEILGHVIDVRRFLDRGQLIFLSKESYLRNGFFDADKLLESIAEFDERALVDGFKALRVVGNTDWVSNYPKVESFLEFEAKLNKLLPLSRSVVLCFFDEKKFDSDLLLKALQVHPKLIVGKKVRENPSYAPPDKFLKKLKTGKAGLQNLQKLIDKKLEREYGEMEEKFKMLFESSFEAVIILKGERIVSCNPKAMEILGIKNLRQVLGKSIYDLFENEELRERVKAAKHEPQFFDLSLTRKGRRIELEASLTKMSDMLMLVARDVTEKREVERRLKESEHRYRLLVESSVDAIVTVNRKAEILTWNKGAERIFGYKADEILGKPLTTLMPKRFQESFWRGFGLLEATFLPGFEFDYPLGRTIEVTCLRKGGDEFPAELSYYAWKSEGEIFFTSIVRDVSEKKKLEKALRESEKKYRELWENAGDILFIIDLEGNFVEANRTAREFFGYSEEEVKKLNINDVVVDYSLAFKEIARMLETRETSFLEWLCRKKNGERIWIEVKAKPVIEGNEIKAIQGIGRDVTERKKLLQALKDSEELFRKLAENSMVGIYLIQDGVFKYVNPKLAELWGYSEKELVGRSPLDFVYSAERRGVSLNLKRLISGELDSVYELMRFVRKDGKIRYSEVYGTSMLFKDKPAVVGTLIDVTHVVEFLKARLEYLKRIDENIQNYMYLVDQIRNPLSIILGAVELKLNSHSELKELKEIVFDSVKRIEYVLSKLDEGWLESEKVKELLEESELEWKWRLNEK